MKRRNKALTVLFSLIPGCGQMFQGFMVCGLELVVGFFGAIMLGSVTDIDELFLLLPIIWVYSFFDSINKMSYDDEKFAAAEDKLIFNIRGITAGRAFYRVCGIVLIVIGAVAVWNMISGSILGFLGNTMTNDQDYYLIVDIAYNIPKAIFALLIIAGGIMLICRKKKEIDNDNADNE